MPNRQGFESPCSPLRFSVPLKYLGCVAVALLSMGVFAHGCRNPSSTSRLAEVDGQVITSADLEKAGGHELFRQRQELYRLEQRKLDEYIAAMLLTREAKRRGVSVTSLLDQEVNSKVEPVRDDDVKAFYESKKDRLRIDFEKVAGQIRQYLQEQRSEDQKALYVNSLRVNAKVVTYLKPPPVFRADIAVDGAPAKGAENAKVTIVKFEDFHCPYCKAVQPIFAELLKRYDGKIRLVHKDLPLDALHPDAHRAAEAARCAGEQGKFWEYHDLLYTNAPKAGEGDLHSYAKQIGINSDSFVQCLDGGKQKAAVQQDLSEAAQLGLTGTPAFFINGRELSGAQPIEAFTAIIDDELSLPR